MREAETETISTYYEIEERPNGFYTRWDSDLHASDKWIGPYPTREAADKAAYEALELVMADFTKTMLGLT